MLARLQQDDDTPPIKDGQWRYYRRYELSEVGDRDGNERLDHLPASLADCFIE
jgi:hypothetical protein